MVRSESDGSAKGSSLIALSPDCPALYFKSGDVACDVDRDPPGIRQCRPIRPAAVKFEIRTAGIVRKLTRHHREGADGDAGKCHIDQVHDLLDRSDLGLIGKARGATFPAAPEPTPPSTQVASVTRSCGR